LEQTSLILYKFVLLYRKSIGSQTGKVFPEGGQNNKEGDLQMERMPIGAEDAQ